MTRGAAVPKGVRLCVTADDFGADLAVNEAVERGHGAGILTAASLMVTGAAAADAVARARRLPKLGVGLHLVLVEGRPALPPDQVPALVGKDGNFRTDMVMMSVAMLRPGVRRQLAAEITAQFEAFAATGLPLDHVNAHKHFHLHPVIGGLIVKIGRQFGMTAIRAPVEPPLLLEQIEPTPAGRREGIAGIWARRAQRRWRRAGLTVPDSVFGLAWSGAMTPRRVTRLIGALPPGLHELYLHPATRDDWSGAAPGYRYRDELAALVDRAAMTAVLDRGVRLGSFASLT